MPSSTSTLTSALSNLTTAVKGMTKWEPEKFNCTIAVPVVSIPDALIAQIKKKLKAKVLMVPNVPHIVKNEDREGHRWLLLNPDMVKGVEDLGAEEVALFPDAPVDPLPTREIKLTMDNFRPGQLLDAVLEEATPGTPTLSSYAIIGHIVHCNLKQYHLPYKTVIGEILIRSLKQVSVVINKTNTIDNTFRNFAMEVLAGEGGKYDVEVKESGCTFKFDFSSVYWNPRLSTEHARLVKLLEKDDWLLDVFAGVGPFAVPAGKKCAKVIANDLNPHSAKALAANLKLNKLTDKKVTVCNKDGRAFIREDVKAALINPDCKGQVQVAMNLPALAADFVDAFRGLFLNNESILHLPTVHVYSFSSCEEDMKADVRKRVETSLGVELKDCEVLFVRKVAPKKDMFRATFKVTEEVMRGDKEPEAKKQKIME